MAKTKKGEQSPELMVKTKKVEQSQEIMVKKEENRAKSRNNGEDEDK
jgi:hypothetical protein